MDYRNALFFHENHCNVVAMARLENSNREPLRFIAGVCKHDTILALIESDIFIHNLTPVMV
tara:strand:- start:279 stop:461 length:183 start_codon:yes stop_codon:yes gene_type:complete